MSFVATYHPKLQDLGKLIKNLQLLLYSDSEVKIIFHLLLWYLIEMLGKQRTTILRSKLYPLERKVGSYRCGNSRCQVCTSIQVTDNFSSL